jgi:hypothetical protein
MAKIDSAGGGSGLMGSKAFKVGMGFFTGGPVGAGMALLPDNGLGGAAKVAHSAGAFSGGAAAAPSAPKMPIGNIADNAAGENAIGRALKARQGNPDMQVQQGLVALQDPSVPDEIRKAYAEPLLRAKYYGGRSVG